MAGQRRSWTRNRFVRAGAIAAIFLGPMAAVPVLLASASDAAGTSCPSGYAGLQWGPIDSATGTVTVSATAGGCEVVSFAEYSEEVAPNPAALTTPMFPQTLVDVVTADVTEADSPLTLTVPLQAAGCASQLDLIYGADTPSTLSGLYFTPHQTLIESTVTGTTVCQTTPPTCTSTSPSPSSSATVTVTDSVTTPPTGSSTSSTAPPVGTTSSAVPVCTTTTTPPPVTSSSASPSQSTSVLPTTTTKAPNDGSTPTPTQSTVVLPYTATKSPQTLPFTGPNLPVRDTLLGALALLSIGGGLILFAGRLTGATANGSHRRRH